MKIRMYCERCGAEYQREVYNKYDNKQTKEFWRSKIGETFGLCENCYQAKRKAEWEEKNKQAMKKASEQGLLQLEGSEKQVAWANSIRQKFIEGLQEEIEDDMNTEEDVQSCKKCLEFILTKTEAKWFIDNRNNTSFRLAKKLSKGEMQ